MKLFAIYIGGKTANSNIELHDMRFVAGTAIEDCYPALRAQWWGTPQSLHLDCWGVLDHADGHDIDLRKEPYDGAQKFWFLNLGGYDAGAFTELHRNIFLVAESEHKAKLKALKQIASWQQPHRDAQMEVETVLCLDGAALDAGWHVHPTPSAVEKPFAFTCRYVSIAL